MDRLRAWCEQHAWGPVAVTLVSAFSGVPPFAVFSVLAGSLRMPWWLFLPAGLVGRFARFLAILLAPGLLPDGLLDG
jgi:membrane protein YqaA with SNARE-associated domain